MSVFPYESNTNQQIEEIHSKRLPPRQHIKHTRNYQKLRYFQSHQTNRTENERKTMGETKKNTNLFERYFGYL